MKKKVKKKKSKSKTLYLDGCAIGAMTQDHTKEIQKLMR